MEWTPCTCLIPHERTGTGIGFLSSRVSGPPHCLLVHVRSLSPRAERPYKIHEDRDTTPTIPLPTPSPSPSDDSPHPALTHNALQVQHDATVHVRELDACLAQLAAAMPVDVMPGATDLTNVSLPQQPLNRCLFPHAAALSTFSRVTNPYNFQLAGVQHPSIRTPE